MMIKNCLRVLAQYKKTTLISLISLLSLFLAFNYLPLSASAEGAGELDNPIWKAMGCKQIIKQMPNGLKVWLISAPQSSTCTLSITAGVGFGDDPFDAMGLSHYCEHTVFLGSKNYPKKQEIQDIAASAGGKVNASTGLTTTSYMLTGPCHIFEECLYRMADMVQNPLFTEGEFQKELFAIENEYKMRLSEDGRSLFTIMFDQTNPSYPLHKHFCGDSQTLASVSSQDLKSWIKQFYVANNMSIVAVSDQSLEKMQEIVEKAFGLLPNQPVLHDSQADPFDLSSDSRFFWTDSASQKMLMLAFSMPMRQDPYSAYLFINEAFCSPHPGGFFDYLIKKKWTTGFNFDQFEIHGGNILTFTFELTQEGVDHVDDLLAAFFDYIEFLKSSNPEHFFDLLNKTRMLSLKTVKLPTNFSVISSLSESLLKSDLKHFPSSFTLPSRSSIKEDIDNLSLINEQSSLAFFMLPTEKRLELFKRKGIMEAPRYECRYFNNRPYYKTTFEVKAKNNSFQWLFPPHNPLLDDVKISFKKVEAPAYISQKSDLKSGKIEIFPNVYEVGSKDALVWNYEFEQSEKCEPLNLLCFDLMSSILNEKLTFFAAQASQAIESFSINAEEKGFTIKIHGLSSSSQDKIAHKLAESIRSFKPTKEAFETTRSKLISSYRDFLQSGPLQQLPSRLYEQCIEEVRSTEELLIELQNLSFESFEKWCHLLSQKAVYFHILAVSNRSLDEWKELFNTILSYLPENSEVTFNTLPFTYHFKNSPVDQCYFHNREGNLVAMIWPLGKIADDSTHATLRELGILDSYVHTKLFEALRTEGKMAYAVQSKLTTLADEPVLMWLVLSTSATSNQLIEAMELFAKNLLTAVNNLEESYFEEQKQSLYKSLIQPFDSSRVQLGLLQNLLWKRREPPLQYQKSLSKVLEIKKEQTEATLRKVLSRPPILLKLCESSEAKEIVPN